MMPKVNEMFSAILTANAEPERARDVAGNSFSTRRSLSGPPPPFESDEIVGDSPQIHFIKQCIDRVAPSEATVLITGETGAGKELFARRLHRMSERRDGPLVSINCAAIPDSLIESELFGFEKGAFTGAATSQEGRLLQAHRGTLFLDEIGDLSPSAQAKILRVLEQKEVQPLGSRTPRIIDIRVVAATNRNLEQLSDLEKFRQDLFFRISVINLHIPPLRDRQEDIPQIATHFLRSLSLQYNRPFVSLTPAATSYLKRQPWKGNVRELRNVVERALLFSNSAHIGVQDLSGIYHSMNVSQAASGIEILTTLRNEIKIQRRTNRSSIRTRDRSSSENSEFNQLRNALEQTKWNKTKTAEILQWSRMTIYRKIVQYDLHPPIDVSPGPDARQDWYRD